MRLDPHKSISKVGGRYLLSSGDGKVYVLNETAAFLWKNLQGQDFDIKDVIVLLTEHFEIDEESARHDSEILMEIWQKHKLLL